MLTLQQIDVFLYTDRIFILVVLRKPIMQDFEININYAVIIYNHQPAVLILQLWPMMKSAAIYEAGSVYICFTFIV